MKKARPEGFPRSLARPSAREDRTPSWNNRRMNKGGRRGQTSFQHGRAISGASMGGYGALTLGFPHPDLFCSVSGHSAALRITDRWRDRLKEGGDGPVPLGKPVKRVRKTEKKHPASLAGYEPKGRIVANTDQVDALDPYKLVLKTPPERLPDIRIDCGIDESLGAFSQRFAKRLMEHKITFTFSQEPGLIFVPGGGQFE